MNQNDHGRLIALAAKQHLSPLGLKRIGRSRRWLSDHGFWVIQVEFQPSGWSKGSYLNVGAHWLWSEWRSAAISFDYGDRVQDFVGFQDVEQFAVEADSLASHAAIEVERIRSECQPITAAARLLGGKAGQWPQSRWMYDAAVAAGLSDQGEAAQNLFDHLLANIDAGAAPNDLRAIVICLKKVAADPIRLSEEISMIVTRRRDSLKLPSIPDPLQDYLIT